LVAVPTKHHLITTIEVTGEANDRRSLAPIAQQAKEDLGLAQDASLTVIADTGYGTGPQHTACEASGTIALVPVQKPSGKSNGFYNSDAFTRDPASDIYICPQGEVLARKADTKARDPECGFRTYAFGSPLRRRMILPLGARAWKHLEFDLGFEAGFDDPVAALPIHPSTSSIASMSSCMVASVSLPMLEMRKVRPLILP
jgi:hypothetical protein